MQLDLTDSAQIIFFRDKSALYRGAICQWCLTDFVKYR